MLWPLVAAAMSAGGCGDKKAETSATGPTLLTARQNAYVADIPVPEGFTLDEGESLHKVYARVRVIDHVYDGRADPLSVCNFYVTRMPEQGWTLLTRDLNDGEYITRFRKDSEFCEVRVARRAGGALLGRTRVRVMIEPQEEAGPQQPATPP